MTFFIKTDAIQPDKNSFERVTLSQRGRAGMEVLGAMQKYSSTRLRDKALEKFESHSDTPALIKNAAVEEPEKQLENLSKAKEIAFSDPVFRLERFIQRYVAEENFVRGIPAVEERREQLKSFFEKPGQDVGGTLEFSSDVTPPEWWVTDWHLEPGGWDAYDLYGPMMAYAVGPHVFRHGGYAYLPVGADIRSQRLDVAKQLPKKSYKRIYELGCGAGTTLFAMHRLHPEAELYGCDLSTNLIRGGHVAAEKLGIKVNYRHRNAEDTGEADNSFDAVYTYALHHEMPVAVSRKVLEEAYRILEPGGDFMLSDIPPFRKVHPFNAILLDWETEHRGEPYFREHCLSNWAEVLRDIGFEAVEEYPIGDNGYPYIVRGRKPL